MRITKYNKLLDTTSVITVASETETYPKENMTSEALVEKTEITTDVIIDIGSVITGTNSIIIKVSDNITSLRIDGNFTNVWSLPNDIITTLTTKYSNYFIFDLGASNYRYYRITPTGTGDKYFNWLYIGENIVFPNLIAGSYPDIIKPLISNATNGGQVYTTSGVAYYEQEINFSMVEQSAYLVFEDWWISTASSYNQLFYQFDSRLDDFRPFYCHVQELKPIARDRDYYDFKIKIREAK